MRRRGAIAALAVGVAALGIAAFALAGGSGAGFNHLKATMSGYQEVPAVSSTGTADFTADVSQDGSSIAWQLSYSGLEGNVLQSHIHFGQRSVIGGSGTFTAADVSPNIPATLAARNQGINTGEYVELVRAIAAGKTYANLHTTTWPSGEIRAQLNEDDPHN